MDFSYTQEYIYIYEHSYAYNNKKRRDCEFEGERQGVYGRIWKKER